jgi:23S rRNA pseudouridine2604 synthase
MRLDDRELLPMKVKRAGPLRLRFELVEGMKHQIRRCCSKVGLEVEDLLRDAVGPIRLGDLPEGGWRVLSAGEIEGLRSAPERRRRSGGGPKKT